MLFPQEPNEVVFEYPGSNLKISSASKAPFSVDNGLFEVLKSKKSEKYMCQVSNADKKRICSITSSTKNQFMTRGNQFSLKIISQSVATVLSGYFDSADEVTKLESLIQGISNKRFQWHSKEKLIPTKENASSKPASSLNRSHSKPKENFPKPIPKRLGMKNSLSNPVFAKNRTPLASLPQITPSTPNTDDIKITAIGGKKVTSTPTANFYGQTKIPKMMSPPDRFKNTPGKSSASKFPPYSSTRFVNVSRAPRFKYEKKDEKKTSPTDGVVGFANLGNTCYMNAILQCLLNIPNFYQELRNENNIDIVPHESLYNRLCNLGVIKHNHEGADVQRRCLQKVKQSISEAAKRFSGYAQHDAHEFLCQCLDQLKEDLSNELSKKKDEIQLPENELNMLFTCPIKENFETTVVHSITCSRCKEEVVKTEEYHDFSLVIPDLDENLDIDALTITILLKLYFSDECIEYTCDKCQGGQSILSHRFQKLPRVLVLHLKRYDSYDAKRSDQITIPKVLNINKQISADTVIPKEFAFNKSIWQEKQSGTKRKPSAEIEDTPSSKTPKTTLAASSCKKDLKAGEMLAMAHRDSIRDEELRKKTAGEFTKIKGPRKSLFPEDSNAATEPDGVKFIPDNLTSVSDDEEAELQKALELSMQEYENQQKTEMMLYTELKSEPKEESRAATPKTNKNIPFMDSSFLDTESDIDYGKKQLYHLVGIVNHHGLNTASGHYTCDCYDFKSKQWRNYNDSSVKEIKEEELFTERKQSAYIVYYMHSSCYEAIESCA